MSGFLKCKQQADDSVTERQTELNDFNFLKFFQNAGLLK